MQPTSGSKEEKQESATVLHHLRHPPPCWYEATRGAQSRPGEVDGGEDAAVALLDVPIEALVKEVAKRRDNNRT